MDSILDMMFQRLLASLSIPRLQLPMLNQEAQLANVIVINASCRGSISCNRRHEQVILFAGVHYHCDLPLFVTALDRELAPALRLMFDKAERKLKHFSSNHCGNVKNLALVSPPLTMKPRFTCKGETYFPFRYVSPVILHLQHFA